MIAAVPAAVMYVRGRQLARFADDPALPERLFADRRKTSSILVLTIAVLFAVAGTAAIWAIPLAVMAYFGAALPLRRILYQETWRLPVYLSFVARFFIAFWSFWLLVCALPATALSAGDRAWLAALVIGAGLTILASRQTELARWLLGVSPIEEPAMRARFQQLAASSGIASPHFELVDLKGGRMANAFALPSLSRSAVVFTEPLLRELEPEEADAICAHELAHLEYYSPRRLRRRRLVCRSLIVAGALLSPLLQRVAPAMGWFACAAWPVVILVVIARLAQDRQKHETASDLRAVALTGNPEALIRGLVKLHALARVPRRWDSNLERHMTHPSLKRRIQDIRAAAGTAPAALGDDAVFQSADGHAQVVLGSEGVEWIEGHAASYRLCYDRLSDLRIAATRGGETRLVAADRTGHRWQMALRIEDVPRLQAVLDIVDARVEGHAPAAAAPAAVVRAAALVLCIVSLNSGMIAAAMVLAATLARPETPLLAASGLAGMGAALLVWRDSAATYGFIPPEFEWIFAAALLVTGMLLLWLAYTRRREPVSPLAWRLVALVGVAAIISWVLPMLGNGLDAIGLHQSAREWPGTVVLPLALAGALVWSSRQAVRVGAALAASASIVAIAVGSQMFLDRFGNDPFLVPSRDLTVRTLDRPVKEFTVPFGVSQLQLSPTGRSIAVFSRRRGNRSEIHLGRAGEALTSVDGDGALFVDDDRVLVWTVDGSRTDLRVVLVATPDSTTWRREVSGISNPTVSLDPQSRRWRITSSGVGVVESREGAIGTDDIESYRWPVPDGHALPFMPIALSADRALAVEPILSTPTTDPLGALVFALASASRWRSTLWALGPDGATDLGTSRLELECHRLPVADRGACQTFDASRTRFFTLDPKTRAITGVAALRGRFFASEQTQNAWIIGWYQSSPLAVRLGPVAAIRVSGPQGVHAHMLAASDRVVAGVWHQMPLVTSGIRVDAVYQEAFTATIRIYPIN